MPVTTRNQFHEFLQSFPFRDLAEGYWDKAFLHLPGAAGDIADQLYSQDDLEAVTRLAPQAPHPYLSLNRNGNTIASANYSRAGTVDADRVRQLFEGGATLITGAVQEYSRNVLWLVRHLENAFGCKAHANAYYTPANSQGFDVHHDPHHVLVVQTRGRKKWRLYGFDLKAALRHIKIPDRLSPEARELQAEIVLEPGDVLYVPRGLAHEAASCETESSLHLTFGLHPVYWVDVLIEGLRQAAGTHQELRHASPVGRWTPAHVTKDDVATMLEKTKTWFDLEAVLDSFRERQPFRGEGAQELEPVALEPAGGWQARFALLHDYRTRGNEVQLEQPFAPPLRLKRACEPLLKALREDGKVPPEPEQLLLVRHLWRCGLVSELQD